MHTCHTIKKYYTILFSTEFSLFLCYSEILSLQVRITDQPLCALLTRLLLRFPDKLCKYIERPFLV